MVSWMGFFRLWQGRAAEAREIAERLRRLDPLDPSWIHELHAYACYLLGDYSASLESFRRWRNNEHYRGLANLAACLAQLGRIEEAKAAWRQCQSAKAEFTIEDYKRGSPYRRPEDLAHWLDSAQNRIHRITPALALTIPRWPARHEPLGVDGAIVGRGRPMTWIRG